MKPITFLLLTLTVIVLLGTTGCFFPGYRERSYDRGRPGYEHNEDHPPGVDHQEHPGDMDHGENH
jgi:hypothetical protein